MGSLLGYARVSTSEQRPALQLDALDAAGCWKTWTDHASGAKAQRPELDKLMRQLRPGDTLVVWRLDRLGRSLPDLIAWMNDLTERGVAFRSLTEAIDTSTAGGRLIAHIFGSLAEFERELIRERTSAGLTAARARGRHGGRPSVMTPKKLAAARDLWDSHSYSLADVAASVGVSRSTLHRHLTAQKQATAEPEGR